MKTLHKVLPVLLCLALRIPSPASGDDDLFSLSASLEPGADNTVTVLVRLAISEPGHIYADSVSVRADNAGLEPLDVPPGKPEYDPFLEKNVVIYDKNTTLKYLARGAIAYPVLLRVRYQGCSDKICFPPEEVRFSLEPGTGNQAATEEPAARHGQAAGRHWQSLVGGFSETGRAVGYMKPDSFIRFLESAQTDGNGEDAISRFIAMLNRGSLWLTVMITLLGGLALNLTPCVLPMIPVNIAIIGAGAAAGSRRRGFALGVAYGCGMAAAYGALGLVFVLTGARFGALQSMPAFSIAVSALFLVLALAMFDVLTIDFSKLQAGAAGRLPAKRNFAVVLVMGMIAALLAGACVAPVVIAVLWYSTSLYTAGRTVGLVLPFLLGAGMALPWPFAGAGLSFLPRPGRWMTRIKQAFGLVMLVVAAYYGMQAFNMLRRTPGGEAHGGWLTSLSEAFDRSATSGRPVLIDFTADWCKSCRAMDKTTFRDPAVIERLTRFEKVRFEADDQRHPAVREALDHFRVLGLPTYVVLRPSNGKAR